MSDTAAPSTRQRRLLPASATRDTALLLWTRGVRAFGDGYVSILLPLHLTLLGYSGFQVGAITTATLLGSAALTLYVGMIAVRLPRQLLLTLAALLMIATGLGFAFVHAFWPLLVIAFVGTLNPSSGDVSVFLPTEQALLPQTIAATDRTATFARYTLIGSLIGAFGALSAGLPSLLAARTPFSLATAIDAMFILYGALGLVALLLYRQLSPAIEPSDGQPNAPLGPSKGMVYRLAALFSLDSFGSGFAVQSLMALWFFNRFGASAAGVGRIFFWASLFSASSQLLAPRVAKRIGLIRTMAFTHIPANIFLMLAAVMPTLPLSVGCLLIRGLFSNMDVPARQSYVMAVVSPPERPAAASVTNVPRSLASAIGPLIAGWLYTLSPFGWPLIISGALKITYDLLLLVLFQSVKPPEER